MKDYFPTKPFDYAAFVDEITDLVEVGETLHERHSASEGFRRWQHELQDLINRTRRIGYPVNCGVAQRHFSSDFSDLADNPVELNSTAFERDMADTLMEQRLIIANFRKYG